jgi:hypothetical protein
MRIALESLKESFLMSKSKCRNPEARALARKLIKGDAITRSMASSDEVWIAARASAAGVASAYHAKLIKNGVAAEKRRAWLRRQHDRIAATFGSAPSSSLPSWLIASLGEVDAATDAPPWNVAA